MTQRSTISSHLILLIVPVGLAVALLLLGHVKGPHWLEPDPDYAYFLSSVSLAELRTPGYPDHPGLTVKIIAALTMRIQHVMFGDHVFADDALLSPERYIFGINVIFIVLACMLVYISGVSMTRVTGEHWLGLLCQSSIMLVFSQLSYSLCKLNAEAVLFTISLAVTVLSLETITESTKQRQYRQAILFGIVSTWGLLTKLNFIPVLILPLLLLRGLRTRLLYLFSLGTCTAVMLLIMGADASVFLKQLQRYVFRTGVHGQNGAGIIPSNLGTILNNLVHAEPFVFMALACAAGALFAGTIYILVHSNARLSRVLRVLASLIVVIGIQILAVIRSPLAYYLMPVLGCLTAVVPLSVYAVTGVRHGVISRSFYVVAIVILWSVTGAKGVRSYCASYRQHTQMRHAALQVTQVHTTLPTNSSIIYDKSVLFVQTALHFGNDACARRHSERLARLYPKAYFYHPWLGSYHTWTHTIEFNQLWLQSPVLHLLGMTNYTAKMRGGLKAPTVPLLLITNVAYVGYYHIVTNIFGTQNVPGMIAAAHPIIAWTEGWFVNTQIHRYAECTNCFAGLMPNTKKWAAVQNAFRTCGHQGTVLAAFMDWYGATDDVLRAHSLHTMRSLVTHRTWPFYYFALRASPHALAQNSLISPDMLVTSVFAKVPLWDRALVWFAQMYQEHEGTEEVMAYWTSIASHWPGLRGAAVVNMLAVVQQSGDTGRGVALIRDNLNAVRAVPWTKDRACTFLERAGTTEAKQLLETLQTQ